MKRNGGNGIFGSAMAAYAKFAGTILVSRNVCLRTGRALRMGRTVSSTLHVSAVLLLLAALTSSAGAQGTSINGQAISPSGKPVPNALIRVCLSTALGIPCSPLTSIYSDFALTHQLPNPTSADQYGNYNIFVPSIGFSAPAGYLVQITAGTSIIYSYVFANGLTCTVTGSAYQILFNNNGLCGGSRITTDAATHSNLNVPGLFSGTGINNFATNYLQPLTSYLYQSQTSQDVITTASIAANYSSTGTVGRVMHGWTNDNDHTDNASASTHALYLNTDAQVGGFHNDSLVHYGKGDAVSFAFDNWSTGVDRGNDEGAEMFRVFVQPRGDNWGITIGTLTTDSMGQAIAQSTLDGGGVPFPLAGHSLMAATENDLVINITSGKNYSTGNIQSISSCPSSITADASYVCLTGDTASALTAKYGTTTKTTLTAAIPISNGVIPDQFVNGPVVFDIPVASTSGFTVGGLFAISSANADFEMPAVISINTGASTIRAALQKSHPSGELVTTGGGVGYAVSFPADDAAPYTWPGGTDGHSNGAIYRLATPVIGTFAGNIVMTTTFPYNQGDGLGTLAFSGTQITALPVFTPQLSGGSLVGFNESNFGNSNIVFPAGTSNRGGSGAPIPTIVFSASCSVQPTAHLIYHSGQGEYVAVVDTPGSGCSGALTSTASLNYANPYVIWPAAWSRSNFNAAYSTTGPNTPQNQLDPNQVMTQSTSGYMVLSGVGACSSTTGFCVGDAIENVYNTHQQQTSQINFFRKIYAPGTNGTLFNMNFYGHSYPDALHGTTVYDPFSVFYGNAASHFGPAPGGIGAHQAPTEQTIRGPRGTIFYLDSPPANQQGLAGTVISITCQTGDGDAPCHNGQQWLYRLVDDSSSSTTWSLDVDPSKNSLTLTGYSFIGSILNSTITNGVFSGGSISGTTTATTQSASDNSTLLATTAFVKTAIAKIQGITTLVAGTSTVTNSAACSPGSTCTYKLTNCGPNSSTAIGTLSTGTITVGTSFVIKSLTSSNTTATGDISTVCWQIN